MKKLILAATLLMAFSTSFAEEEKDSMVNLIGLDENGKELNVPIKSKKWKRRMTKVFKRVGGDVLPKIRSHEDNEKFEFKQFDLGLYVAMNFKVASVLKIKIEPYFKLFFKK